MTLVVAEHTEAPEEIQTIEQFLLIMGFVHAPNELLNYKNSNPYVKSVYRRLPNTPSYGNMFNELPNTLFIIEEKDGKAFYSLVIGKIAYPTTNRESDILTILDNYIQQKRATKHGPIRKIGLKVKNWYKSNFTSGQTSPKN